MGCVHDAERSVRSFAQPLEDAVLDIGATAIGQPELIPLINAGVSAANGGSIGQDLLAGGEALAGQELAGAIGIGQGNSVFNDALGITGDNPAGLGLPDLGAAATNAIGGVSDTLGLSGGSSAATGTNAAGAFTDASGQTVAAPSATTSVAPSSGSGFTAASNLGDFSNNQINAEFGAGVGGQPALTGDIPGASTAGATSLGNISGNNSLSLPAGAADLGANVESGGASGTGIGSKAFDLLSQPGAPSAGTVAANDQTFNSLQGSGLPGTTASPTAATSSAAAPATTPSSGGLLNTVENTAIKSALPLGALAYEAIKGPSKLPSQAAALESGGAATAPLLALEKQGATEASTGQLTAPQQANVLQYVQQSQNQLLQQLASQGVTNPTQDSRYLAGLQQIQQNALALQQQYITAAISEATSAGGAASANIANVANDQIQNDTAFQEALAQAFGALGGSVGGGIIQPRAA